MGQHFLRSQKVLDAIIDAAHINQNDTVLEIGPGEGALTRALASRASRVIAIEKDMRFVQHLEETCKDLQNITIIHGDALTFDVRAHIEGTYKIVANLPYYITSHFLRLFLENKTIRPESMTIMIQLEVAKRITAHAPDMNMLALCVQVYGTPKNILKVSRSLFSPPPRVDSAIITITNINDSFFEKYHIDQNIFFETTKKAFSQKRKMLKNTLGIESLAGGNRRPQELSLEEWAKIVSHYIKK